jgi:hypothetical protein
MKQNKETSCNCFLNGVGRRLRGRKDGGELTNVQHKPNRNYLYESPHPVKQIYPNKTILIKKKKSVKLGIVTQNVIPTLGRRRQEECKFEDSMDYIASKKAV